jgi:Protein of unknown function (DUF3455)
MARSRLAVVSMVAVAVLAGDPARGQSGAIAPAVAEIANFSVNASGVQIYECKAGADGKLMWAFKEPRADLTLGGKSVGRHYAGPHWEMADGSTIKGAVASRADAPAAASIPWLRLTVVEAKGAGQLTSVVAILRTETKGGVLAGACAEAGKLQEQPYTSDYVFLKKR